METQKAQQDVKLLMGIETYFPYVDGVVICMDNYSKVLVDKIDLLAFTSKSEKDYVDDSPYPILRCKSLYIPFFKLYYGFPQIDKKFKKTIYEGDANIIHIHSPFHIGHFALKVAKYKNIPIVATFHTNFRPIFKKIFKFSFLTELAVKIIGNFYNKLDEIFVCSPEIEKQARSFGYTGKISMIPFGTEYAKVDNCAESKKNANEKFNIDENENIFLFVGRVMELKRIDFTIESLKILKNRGIKFKFFVCGKGMYIAKLKALCEKLDLVNEVIFTGFVPNEDISLLYTRADLFLFPSLYDNFGLVKVEAAAHFTPSILIKDSASAVGITDGVNGFLSEDNQLAFAEKIIEAISDKKHLNKIGEHAARDIYQSWEECVDILIGKYKEIINNRQQTEEFV